MPSPYVYDWLESATGGYHTCPHCGGGSTSESSCSVFWHADRKYAKCHRASCGLVISVGGRYQGRGHEGIAAPAASPSVLRPYTGDRYDPGYSTRKLCIERWGFLPEGIQTVAYGTERQDTPFLIPILAPNGAERGLMEAVYGSNKRRRIWRSVEGPCISWTPEADYYDGVYLVEDQISALKLHHVASIRACALLGTSLNAESVAEIQRTARNVTIALDADATAKAFLLARKWGAAFKSCEVCILTQDIKDMSFKDIQGLMHDRGHIPTSSGGEF